MSETREACTQRRYEVSKKDLPISCPMPDMPAWNLRQLNIILNLN